MPKMMMTYFIGHRKNKEVIKMSRESNIKLRVSTHNLLMVTVNKKHKN